MLIMKKSSYFNWNVDHENVKFEKLSTLGFNVSLLIAAIEQVKIQVA